MISSDFPSGPWTGFYTYRTGNRKHRTDLILTFSAGRITGEGRDQVGPFVISGSYDQASRECSWIKSYVGAHDVNYTGFGENKGIWGTWVIRGIHRGGFHIWPLGEEGDGETIEIAEEKPAVVAKPGYLPHPVEHS